MKYFNFLFLSLFTINSINIFPQWTYQQAPTNASHYITIEFSNNLFGAVGGGYIGTSFLGRGAYTTNGGINWLNSQIPDSTRIMAEIKFVNQATGYCAGAYNLNLSYYRRTDLNYYDKNTLQLLKQNIGETVDEYKGLFLKTTNSGQSWFTYGVLPSNIYYMHGIHFINTLTGFATVSYDYSGGVNEGVIKTFNGGLNWSVLTMPENINSLGDIYFTDINTGFASGRDNVNDTSRGVILRTTNSGLSWQRQVFMQTREFSGIHFDNNSTGYAVTYTLPIISDALSQIYKTTNSGISWVLIKSFNNVEAYGIKSVPGTGITLTYGTKYLLSFESIDFFAKTTNYGANWIESTLNDSGAVIFDVKMLDNNNWHSSGGDFQIPYKPMILKTTNGGAIGITQTSNEVPEKFALLQNYPNPFNPSTKIKFQIPAGGNNRLVRIAVYDILGKQVALLVDERLSPGNYEVNFNSSGLTSGAYLYELRTDGYSETKKMVVIK